MESQRTATENKNNMKYKIGQKVKVISRFYYGNIRKGSITTIKAVRPMAGSSDYTVFDGEDDFWYMEESWLKPFKELPFKVGDRVRILKYNWSGENNLSVIGKTGIITKDISNGDKRYKIYDDGNHYLGLYNPDEIELVTDNHENHVAIHNENPEKEGGEKYMAFTVGDKVKGNEGACTKFDEICTVYEEDDELRIKDESGSICTCDYAWELISSAEETMAVINKLTKAQKESWTKDQQALYQVGITDSSGNVNGSPITIEALVRVNRKALVAQAESDIAEQKAEEEAAKAKSV